MTHHQPSAAVATDQRKPLGVSDTFAATAVVTSAALAMAATLPARTHGLGLITTRLLGDFAGLDQNLFAQINFVGTLVGSLFCIPCGWLLDRLGVRPVLAAVMIGLGVIVVAMSRATEPWMLAVSITLARGVGQSMLSVVSIAMLGKWFGRNPGGAMGWYAVLMTILMAAGTGALAARITGVDWRVAWQELGVVILLLAPVAWVLAPRGASGSNLPRPLEHSSTVGAPLSEAVRTGCFWVFAGSIALFSLVSSGVTLFQQLILEERGLAESVFHVVLIIGLLSGLVANLVGGWLSKFYSMSRLLAAAMLLLAGSLAALPLLESAWQAYLQAVVAGVAGGLVTVLFFAVWVHAFGPRHLGRIQGAAQMITVLASASGPLVIATARSTFDSYAPVLYALAVLSTALAAIAWQVTVPSAVSASSSAGGPLPSLVTAGESRR